MASMEKDNFIVDASKRQLVEKHLDKAERLFKVNISFDVVFEEGETKKQWLSVSGNKDNKINAKSYILAMCHPEQTVHWVSESRHLVDEVLLEKIEQRTCAFLRRTGPTTLDVMGSELPCILAVSELEHTYPVRITDTDEKDQHDRTMVPRKENPERKRHCHNLSPTGMLSPQVEALNVDSCADPDIAGTSFYSRGTPTPSQNDSGIQMTSSPFAATPQQKKLRESESRAFLQPPGKIGGQALRRGGAESSRLVAGGSTSSEDPAKTIQDLGKPGQEAADAHKSELLRVCKDKGYSEAEVEETWQFFDFTEQLVQQEEFLCALHEVHTSKKKRGRKKAAGGSSPCKQGQDMNTNSKSLGQDREEEEETRRKTRGKGITGTAARGGQTLSPVAKSKPTPPKPQGKFGPGHLSDTRQNAPTTVVVNGGGELREGRRSLSGGDDSVIFVGEDFLNDSVILVDAYAAAAAVSPPAAAETGSRNRCKRKSDDSCKGYSDDEDQTTVLKPFSTNAASAGPAANAPSMQLADPSLSTIERGPSSSTSYAVNAENQDSDLRYIVIDGSNVAMSHGNDKVFSCRGIKLCVEYFVRRGHKVKAWVPLTKSYRNQGGRHPQVLDQEVLEELKDQGYLGFTPARKLGNLRHIVSHDDYFILDLARLEDAVIVSRDNFREFLGEYRDIIETRVLSYVFSDDHFMLPRDPLGRNGPRLDAFLRKPPPNPFKRSAITREVLMWPPGTSAAGPVANNNNRVPGHHSNPAVHPPHPSSSGFRQPAAASSQRHPTGPQKSASGSPKHSLPQKRRPVSVGGGPGGPSSSSSSAEKLPPRPPHMTHHLLAALQGIFPEKEQAPVLERVLENHPGETDLNKLTNFCICAMDF